MSDQETVLVIGNDGDYARCIGEALSSGGYRIASFQNGSDSLKFVMDRSPIAVFVDLAIAVRGAGEFLHRFRAIHPFVPIIVTHRNGETEDLISAVRYGVQYHLMKPFSAHEAREALSKALREDESECEKALLAISTRLREARRRLGLKQSVVALRAKLSVAQICQIEKRASTPSLEALLRICRVLRTPVGEIVAGV